MLYWTWIEAAITSTRIIDVLLPQTGMFSTKEMVNRKYWLIQTEIKHVQQQTRPMGK